MEQMGGAAVPNVRGCRVCSQRRADRDKGPCTGCIDKDRVCVGLDSIPPSGQISHGNITAWSSTGSPPMNLPSSIEFCPPTLHVSSTGFVEERPSWSQSEPDQLMSPAGLLPMASASGELTFSADQGGLGVMAPCHGTPPAFGPCNNYLFDSTNSVLIAPIGTDVGATFNQENNCGLVIPMIGASPPDESLTTIAYFYQKGDVYPLREEGDNLTTYLDCHSRAVGGCGGLLPDNISPLPSIERKLLEHYLEAIAPELEPIDGEANGWRHIIIPLAVADESVRAPVLAMAAFHMRKFEADLSSTAEKLYGIAVGVLVEMQQPRTCGEKQLMLLSIIAHLAISLVTGSRDFALMYGLLETTLQTFGGDRALQNNQLVSNFILRQIRKFRLYAAPSLNLEEGFRVLQSASQSARDPRGLTCDTLKYYDGLYPVYSTTFRAAETLHRMAFDMYLYRLKIMGGGASDGLEFARIAQFIERLKGIRPRTIGGNYLIWPCFIAAAESKSTVQRKFLKAFLVQQFRRSRFDNIMKALSFLSSIGTGTQRAGDWPKLLADFQVLIM